MWGFHFISLAKSKVIFICILYIRHRAQYRYIYIVELCGFLTFFNYMAKKVLQVNTRRQMHPV